MSRRKRRLTARKLPPEEEASIYIRLRGVDGQPWYVITKDTRNADFLTPVFLKNKKDQEFAACTAVGSTVFVLGGEDEEDECRIHNRFQELDTVNHIDANYPTGGWKGGGGETEKLCVCRVNSYAVAVKNQIYVFGGRTRPSKNYLDAEVYDPEGKHSRLLGRMPPSLGQVTSHAVIDGGDKVVLFSRSTPDSIHCYDVNADCYLPFGKGFGEQRIDAVTVLDGVLYGFGYHVGGSILSLDISRPDAVPKPVKGLKNLSWMPRSNSVGFLRNIHLVPISRRKLALVWGFGLRDSFPVYCARMMMMKMRNANNEITVVAQNPTLCLYSIKGYSISLTHCLPIFTRPMAESVGESGESVHENGVKKSYAMAVKGVSEHVVGEEIDTEEEEDFHEKKDDNGTTEEAKKKIESWMERDSDSDSEAECVNEIVEDYGNMCLNESDGNDEDYYYYDMENKLEGDMRKNKYKNVGKYGNFPAMW